MRAHRANRFCLLLNATQRLDALSERIRKLMQGETAPAGLIGAADDPTDRDRLVVTRTLAQAANTAGLLSDADFFRPRRNRPLVDNPVTRPHIVSILARMPTYVIARNLARDLKFGGVEQQGLLECANPIERLEIMIDYLESVNKGGEAGRPTGERP